MSQPTNLALKIPPLDLGNLNLRESEYFLPSPDQGTPTSLDLRAVSNLSSGSSTRDVSFPSPEDSEDDFNGHSAAGADRESNGLSDLSALLRSTHEDPASQPTDNSLQEQNKGRWRPSFLTRRSICIFLAILVLLIAALEAIWIISQRNRGLASSNASLHYLWTYGPSAILTSISAFWACVDYEAKAIVPWLRKEKASKKPYEHLTIDYISMFILVVPFRSLARRDFLVAACATVSLLFRLLIVISSSLITLTHTTVSEPVILQTRFVDDSARLSTSGLLPLFNTVGRKSYGLPWLDGTSDYFAYQSIRLPLENVTEFQAVTEGLSFGLECQDTVIDGFAINPTPGTTLSLGTINTTFSINISSPGCNSQILDSFLDYGLSNLTGSPPSRDFGFLQAVRCADTSPSTDGDRRLAWVFGLVNYTVTQVNSTFLYDWTTPKIQSLICQPKYDISDITIARKGNSPPKISLAENPRNRSLAHVQAWHIMDNILNAHNKGFNSDSWDDYLAVLNLVSYLELQDIDGPIVGMHLDDITNVITGLFNESFSDAASFFNATSLQSALQQYCRLYTTFLVHESLMEPAADPAAGTVSFQQQRLIVQTVACQVMVGLCIASILGLLAVLYMVPQASVFSGDPGTITGMAALADSEITLFPRGFGALQHSSLQKALLSNSNPDPQPPQEKTHRKGADRPLSRFYQPVVLHPLSRGAVFLLAIGILIVLEVLLRQSEANQGIGDIKDQTYIHYLWTALPAIVLTLLGLYFSSVDSELRALSPLESLSRRATSGHASLNLRLLGRLYPHTVFKEIRTRKFAAAFATTCSLAASLLPITAGSLFSEIIVPAIFPINLNMIDTLSSDLYSDAYNYEQGTMSVTDRNLLSSLVLESNLSYPADTYEGLVFPALQWPGQRNLLNGPDTMSTLDIKAVLPAVRSRLICHKLPQSHITASILRGFDPEASPGYQNGDDAIFGPAGDRILVNITGEICSSIGNVFPELSASAVFFVGQEAPGQGVFAASSTNNNVWVSTCSGFVFVWGHFQTIDAESGSVSASAVSCNVSIETVNADVVLLGHDLNIDPNRSPSAREDTSQVAIPERNISERAGFSSFYLYSDLVARNANTTGAQGRVPFLDKFFTLLTTSRYAVSLDSLADPAEEDTVIAAISSHHSIISAQAMNAMARLPLPSNTTMTSRPHGVDPGVFAARNNDNTTIIETTASDPSMAQRRVVMDPTATRVLEGLIAATLALALIGWALMPRTAVVPHPATSIVGMLALLVDGNLVETWQSPTGLWTVVVREDEMFRLGWGTLREDEGGHGRNRFGIWAL
ncbi:hypothetical protein F4802DRAFT_572366 [Xylaria palmicola]|nr:hypothetical protein F4802DRAFT_572366 [Xylaria palmicola]